MRLRKSVLSAAVLLMMSGLGVPSAAAAAEPPRPTAEYDVFPGADPPGTYTGPRAASVPGVGTRALTGGPFTGFTCDGTDGPRVEVLYVREATMTNRYTALQPIIQGWLIQADAAWNDGAARGGRSRHIRFLTETSGGSCQAVVRNVVVPAGALATFATSTAAVRALGYTRTDRKYMMLTEGTSVCGVGERYNDDSPGATNLNNTSIAFARVDAGCWGANAIAHELGHTFGAVQPSAPHATTGGGHCSQRFDMMCYGGTPTYDCTEWDAERLPDCAADDYFNVAPPAGSYLATRWNTANSVYLRAGTSVDNAHYPRPGRAYTIRNVASGRALDIDPATGTGSDPLRYLYATTADPASATQKWLLGYQTGTQIMNNKSLLCLDSAYSGVTAGTRALQYTCANQDGMHWAYLPHADGSFTVLNSLSGLALTQPTAAGSLIDQQVYTGATSQRWTFTALADQAPLSDGYGYHVSALNNRETLAAPADAVAGSAVTHAVAGTAARQQWRLVASGASWQLKNIADGTLCVGNDQSTTAGQALTLQVCGTATGQQWTPRRVADGRYMLVNRHSGLAMTMTTAAGSAVQQQALNVDNRAQVFAFAYSGALPETPAVNLLANGGFTDNTDGWWFSDNITAGTTGGRLTATVAGGAGEPWEAMLGQSGLPLEAGATYVLSFDASTSGPVDVIATVELSDDPWTDAFAQVVALTPTAGRYSYRFTSNLTTDAGQVQFQLGRPDGYSLVLDDIALIRQ
jgi:hypothetical protein